MKLNNRGWGYRKMIMYSCSILACLLVAIYYINYLYNDLQRSVKSDSNIKLKEPVIDIEDEEEEITFDISHYKNLEDKLESATKEYVDAGFVDTQQQLVTVSSDKLINAGYLDIMYDQKGGKCSGYSNVMHDDISGYTISSYLYCSDYSTND